MGYFKTPEGLQLYELTLSQLENIYKVEKEGVDYEGKKIQSIKKIVEKT